VRPAPFPRQQAHYRIAHSGRSSNHHTNFIFEPSARFYRDLSGAHSTPLVLLWHVVTVRTECNWVKLRTSPLMRPRPNAGSDRRSSRRKSLKLAALKARCESKSSISGLQMLNIRLDVPPD
jgi:hypothetical protein